jgi:lipopolysaccharide transport system ATP-binding protein
MSTVISVENVSKQYRLGEVGTGTLSHDINRWWYKVRGKEDPYLKIGEVNDRTKKAGSGEQRSEVRSQRSDDGDQKSGPSGSSSAPSLTSDLRPPTSRKSASADYAWALRDVSFEVKQGEVLGIIGRNGAGKSTLLKILSRVTRPTTGEIKVRGRIASLLEVGTGFHPELTGRENIFLNGAILGMRKAEIARKFDEIVEFSGCERYIDTPVKRYSSGMYVRLAFAVAAHLEPEILIVDEVLAVGDAEFQKKCIGKMKDVAGEGRTVLFVSHNMSAVEQLCSRCLLFRNGKVTMDDIPCLITSNYLTDAAGERNGIVDLSSSAARSRSSAQVITQVTLRNNRSEPTTTFHSKRNLIADITICSKSLIKEPRIALAIESRTGTRLFTVASYFSSSIIPSIDDECVIRCNIDPLPLGPGQYLLSLSIATKNDGLIDSLDNAVWFEVLWDNCYETGEGHHQIYGPILVEASWNKI